MKTIVTAFLFPLLSLFILLLQQESSQPLTASAGLGRPLLSRGCQMQPLALESLGFLRGRRTM